MTISIACDECDKQLKIADTFAGKRIKCPQCKGVIAVPAQDEDEEEERPAPRKAAVRAKTAADDKPRGKKSPRAVEDDEDDEKPRKKKASKAVVDDEDDDEDDKPRKKKSARAAAVDDDDEDEDDDDPKAKKKKKKKKQTAGGGGGKLWLWIPLGLGSVTALGAAVFFTLAFFLNWWPFTSGLGAEFKYLPDDCTSITSVRQDEMRKTEIYKAERGGLGGFGLKGDLNVIKEEDVERVTTANPSQGESITILTSKKALTPQDVKDGIKAKLGNLPVAVEFTEETVGSYKLYVSKMVNSLAFAIPEDKILLVGSADTLRKILQRNKKPELPANLKKAYDEADFSKTQVMIFSSTGSGGGGVVPGGKTKQVDAVCIMVDYGSTVNYKSVMFCKDAAAAEEVRKEAEEDLKKESPFSSEVDRERRKNAKISKSGSVVTGSTSVKEQTILNEINKNKQPGGPRMQ